MTNWAYDMDPDWSAAAEPIFASDVAKGLIHNPPVHDVASRRQNADKMYSLLFPPAPPAVPVSTQRYEITSFDGATIGVLAFWPQTTQTTTRTTRLPAIVYAHGGGMISLDATTVQNQTARLAADSGVPFFSVDYRLAPESPHPAPTEDMYHALVWLQTAAKGGQVFDIGTDTVTIDPTRIAVAGESAGGGIAAGVALMARDRHLDPPLAKQILWYPMLDHRTVQPSQVDARLLSHLTWSLADNVTGWSALLRRDVSDVLSSTAADIDSIPGLLYASPARAASLHGLPPTYLDVGFLDLFHDEIVAYGHRFAKENSAQPLELHIFPGLPHGFDGLARDKGAVKRALDVRMGAIHALRD
ncbi:hypothetical protein Sste5346_010426 [Sporothrix stenoceras]|uniref:Alpha/beta hydrolase fold-3 domain-containing protein n=1 Tax=Sporothrix stenoceras TaxID=5173 RepID=A0ABR3YH12_9PEZI